MNSESKIAVSAAPVLTRRKVLEALGATILTLSVGKSISQQAPLDRSQIEQILKPLLTTEDPQLWQFVLDVYELCIFRRMQPAEPPLEHPWLVPGGIYRGQWIWDTTFLTDLLSIIPEQRDFIRGVYQNYWDFQNRWDAEKPDYARGMIANFIAPNSGVAEFDGKQWRTFPAYSQAPLLAWGVERVYRRNHDLDLVRTALPHLEAFHDWYWRERDLDRVGMVTVGSYDGVVQHARYETYDREVDLDTLELTPHPRRQSGVGNGSWYGTIYIPSNTAYLLLSEQCLVRIAKAAGDEALVERRRPIIDRGVRAMRRYMWDDSQRCFLGVQRDGLRKIPSATIGGMVPLQARIPTAGQAARMAAALSGPNWDTPLPIPAVDATDSKYKSDDFWRGDVWPSTVYQTISGLAIYGHRKLAGGFADRLLDNAIKVGISEHYDSRTGASLGVRNLGMSAVMLTIALDGLSPRHRIANREKASS
jgi:putative isomerase